MSMQFLDSVVITNPAGTTVYDGNADVQDNDDRLRMSSDGLIQDQGDGRCFLPVVIGPIAIRPGFGVAITARDGRSETAAIGRIDRTDDSFSFDYDN